MEWALYEVHMCWEQKLNLVNKVLINLINLPMYFLAWASVLSGHHDLMSRSFLKTSRDWWYPSGMASSSGASLSNQCFHCFSLRLIWLRISEKCLSLLSSTRLSQVMSRIHLLGLGGQAFRSRDAPPDTCNDHMIPFGNSRIFTHIKTDFNNTMLSTILL